MSKFFDIELNINDLNLNNTLKEIALEIKPKWSADKDEIETQCVRGGITNSLYACFLKSNGLNHNETILFRIYGEYSEKFISRSSEIETMCLMHKQGLGPCFYGRFRNGICYEYLPGSILDQDMVQNKEIYPKIAKAIAGLHMVEFNGLVHERDLKDSKQIFIFTEIYKLLDLVNDDYQSNMSKMTDELLKSIPNKVKLSKEIEWLKSHLTEYTNKHKSLVVFSHNDLLLGNIIYNDNLNPEIKFIDYEYGCINYQAYDIANHFNEFSGVDSPDYSFFPNKQYQLEWLNIYLNEFYAKLNEFYKQQTDNNNSKQTIILNEEKLNQFYEEVNKFTLASHFMWAVWSLVQAQVSKLNFDFVAYAKIRFDEYFKRKNEIL